MRWLGHFPRGLNIKFHILKESRKTIEKFIWNNDKKLILFNPIVHPSPEITEGINDIFHMPGSGKKCPAEGGADLSMWKNPILADPTTRNVIGVMGITDNNYPVHFNTLWHFVQRSRTDCLNHAGWKYKGTRLKPCRPLKGEECACFR